MGEEVLPVLKTEIYHKQLITEMAKLQVMQMSWDSEDLCPIHDLQHVIPLPPLQRALWLSACSSTFIF